MALFLSPLLPFPSNGLVALVAPHSNSCNRCDLCNERLQSMKAEPVTPIAARTPPEGESPAASRSPQPNVLQGRLSPKALLSAQEQGTPWLWHGYLAPGLVTLPTSQWKSGKTTLVAVLLTRLQPAAGRHGFPDRLRPARRDGGLCPPNDGRIPRQTEPPTTWPGMTATCPEERNDAENNRSGLCDLPRQRPAAVPGRGSSRSGQPPVRYARCRPCFKLNPGNSSLHPPLHAA
jgi:hypothetical protein